MIIRIILAVCIVSVFLVGCEQEPVIRQSGKVVKIGVIGPFSGPDKSWGDNGLLGVKTALELRPWLLNGDKPELIVEDDKNDPALTVKALDKLVSQDRVSAVLVFSGSAAALSIAEIADEYKTPIFALVATHPEITNSQWVSQFGFDDKVQGSVAALFVIDELLIEHVGVTMSKDDPHSVFLAEEFIRKFEEAGGVIDKSSSVNSTTKDFSQIVQGFRGKGLDFLYLPLDADQVVMIKQEAQKMGWNPQVMVSDGLLSIIRLQYADNLDVVDTMLAPDVYTTDLPFTIYGKRVSSIFKEKFSDFGTTFAGLGCEGMSVLLAALDRCEDTSDRRCINQMLRSTDGFTGFFGKLYIRDNGKTERPMFINTIEDTDLKHVVKIY